MATISLSWSDRFALIDHHKPEDAAICAAFGLTNDELSTARALRQAGTFRANKTLDVSKFPNVFTPGTAPIAVNQSGRPGATSHTKPESASRRPKEPQKRGRKGNKITDALKAVPTTPTSVDGFMKQYGVSLAVLRQSKRFLEKLDAETQQQIGTVNVRQDRTSKQLMIWREAAKA